MFFIFIFYLREQKIVFKNKYQTRVNNFEELSQKTKNKTNLNLYDISIFM